MFLREKVSKIIRTCNLGSSDRLEITNFFGFPHTKIGNFRALDTYFDQNFQFLVQGGSG
jgi:CO dehydrogenase/acetyl-CoA synthase beta subunit